MNLFYLMDVFCSIFFQQGKSPANYTCTREECVLFADFNLTDFIPHISDCIPYIFQYVKYTLYLSSVRMY